MLLRIAEKYYLNTKYVLSLHLEKNRLRYFGHGIKSETSDCLVIDCPLSVSGWEQEGEVYQILLYRSQYPDIENIMQKIKEVIGVID